MKIARFLYFDNYNEHNECYVLKLFNKAGLGEIEAIYDFTEDKIPFTALTKAIELMEKGYKVDI